MIRALALVTVALVLTGCTVDERQFAQARRSPLQVSQSARQSAAFQVPPALHADMFAWLLDHPDGWESDFNTYVPETVVENEFIRLNIQPARLVLTVKSGDRWPQYSRPAMPEHRSWKTALEKQAQSSPPDWAIAAVNLVPFYLRYNATNLPAVGSKVRGWKVIGVTTSTITLVRPDGRPVVVQKGKPTTEQELEVLLVDRATQARYHARFGTEFSVGARRYALHDVTTNGPACIVREVESGALATITNAWGAESSSKTITPPVP